MISISSHFLFSPLLPPLFLTLLLLPLFPYPPFVYISFRWQTNCQMTPNLQHEIVNVYAAIFHLAIQITKQF